MAWREWIATNSPQLAILRRLGGYYGAASLVLYWDFTGSTFNMGQLCSMLVDVIFVVEVMLRFFIGIEVKGKYYDRLLTVAWVYVSTPSLFWFDALTSLPISWADFIILQACQHVENDITMDSSQNVNNSNIGMLRVVKILRAVKMGRLFRMFRIFRVASERLDLTPSNMRLFRLLFTLGAVLHLGACFFWRVKMETNSADALAEWMGRYGIVSGDESNIYVTCFYFIATVCFTVGFGDISASNFGERVFCIFLMSVAACVFGLILGELQEIYAAANKKARELDDHMESVVLFLRQNKVPKDVERIVKNFVRFQFPQLRADAQNRQIMDMLPPVLRETLACNINKALFSKVVLWSKIPRAGNVKDQFTADLLVRMQSCFYVAGSVIASCKEEADRLMIIVSGSVSIYDHGRMGDPKGRLFTIGPGASIGDNSVLGDPRWAGHFGIDADFVADDDCKICFFMTSEVLIRRLLERFHFTPDPSDDLLRAPMDQPGLLRARPEFQARQIFHWIRFARTVLHTEPIPRHEQLEPDGLVAVKSGGLCCGIWRRGKGRDTR